MIRAVARYWSKEVADCCPVFCVQMLILTTRKLDVAFKHRYLLVELENELVIIVRRRSYLQRTRIGAVGESSCVWQLLCVQRTVEVQIYVAVILISGWIAISQTAALCRKLEQI